MATRFASRLAPMLASPAVTQVPTFAPNIMGIPASMESTPLLGQNDHYAC